MKLIFVGFQQVVDTFIRGMFQNGFSFRIVHSSLNAGQCMHQPNNDHVTYDDKYPSVTIKIY